MTVNAGSAAIGFQNSIRGKLWSAFGVTVALTACAGVVGFVSYHAVGQRMETITQQNLPAISLVRNLAELSANMAAAGPTLEGAQDDTQRQTAFRVIENKAELFWQALRQAKSLLAGDGRVAELDAIASSVIGNLERQNAAVEERLRLGARRQEVLAELVWVHGRAVQTLMPLKDASQVELRSESDRLVDNTRSAVRELSNTAIANLIDLYELRRGVMMVAGAALAAAETGEFKELDRHYQTYANTVVDVTRRIDVTVERSGAQALSRLAPALWDLGAQGKGIFDVRRRVLTGPPDQAVNASMIELKGRASHLVSDFEEVIEPLVVSARTGIMLSARKLESNTSKSVDAFLDQGVEPLTAYLGLLGKADALKSGLSEAANASSIDQVAALREAGSTLLGELRALVPAVPEEVRGKVGAAIEALAALATGPNSVLALRETELKLAESSALLLERNRSSAEELGSLVAGMVGDEQAKADEAALASARAISGGQMLLAAIVIVSVLAGLLIGWLYVGRNVADRLSRLSEAMRRVSQGDLDAPIPTGGRDEVAGMALALVVFRDTTRAVAEAHAKADRERKQAAEERRSMLRKLADDFETRVQAVVGAVLGNADALRGAAETMAENAGQTQEEAGAATIAGQHTSGNVQAVAVATEELTGSIREIGRQTSESVRLVSTAVDAVSEASQTVHQLDDAAARIGRIVSLIDEVASQTNLLALNATIEAARAGEMGKGFAVVANEVKQLASQTGKATDEISAQIASVQEITQRTVSALTAIARTVSDVDAATASVSSAIEQQQAATQEIARNVSGAASGAAIVLHSVETVSRAAVATGTTSQHVRSAAEALFEEASLMRRHVETFLAEVRGTGTDG
ncbi:MAG: methyl-accepting chemotaxis protein [Alphaproteobacteria bacterium]